MQQEVELHVNAASAERVVSLEDIEQLADLLSLSYEPMLAWHLNAAIKYWNAGAERLYGFAPDEAIGRISHSLLQTKFPIEFNEIHSLLRTKGYWSGELRHVCKDGREVIVDSRMQLHGDDIVLEVNRDITEHKQLLARQAAELIERGQAEAALRDTEERARQLAAIVESNNDSIVATDLKRRITTWNRAAERLYGYTAEEAVGMPIAACTIPEDRHHEEIAIFERIRRGEPVEPFDTVRRRKDGSLIDVSLSVSPVRDLKGQIVGASSISRDITERKRAEERIAMLAREAEHRTRNVLATVQTLVHLSQADTPEGLRAAIEGRLQALSNAHALFIQSRWLGADVLTLARQELAPYLEKQGPRIRIYGPHIPVKPKVAQALAIVLHELTTNAAKYGGLSARHGQVELNWVAVSEHLLLLTWSETGGPIVATPSRRGFGTQMMETLIKIDLAGELRFDWRAEGLVCELEFQI